MNIIGLIILASIACSIALFVLYPWLMALIVLYVVGEQVWERYSRQNQ